MRNKRVSILISNYNKGKYLDKCLHSCFNQNYSNLEVILFDNYSNDNSETIIKKYKKVVFYKKKKISTSSPINQLDLLLSGFKKSSGQLIFLLDSDDFFFKNKIKSVLNYFSKNPNENFFLDKPVILKKNKKHKFLIKKKFFSNNVWPTIFPTSCISFRRNFLLKNKIFLKENKYPLLEIDFRLVLINCVTNRNFICPSVSDELTVYRIVKNGIMSNNLKFSIKWWRKRHQAYEFFKTLLNENNLIFDPKLDWYLTRFINKMLIL